MKHISIIVVLLFAGFGLFAQKTSDLKDNYNQTHSISKDSKGTVTPKSQNTVDNTPLFILDGVVVKQEDVAKIDNNTIENITIVKDKDKLTDYIALYGSRASNGVVLIKSKK